MSDNENISSSSKNKEHDTASESSNESDLETKKIILYDEIEKIRKAIENKENVNLDKTIAILKQVSDLTITDYNRVYEEQNETIHALKLINLNLACEVQYYKGCLFEELLRLIKDWFNDILDMLVFFILELNVYSIISI
ncbi:5479_t:CDS:2 [Cetraspora pellucida]|uniref:5479_t:CDS:1 n=1 Tax=Cetraspora pellucida TaxID=1433469 RepID=A0ACA9M5W5_9GLOM|nr:5479_t:CDS:2 [Cetraspora pellucida]